MERAKQSSSCRSRGEGKVAPREGVVAQCGQKNWCRGDAPGVTSAMDGDFDSAMAVWAMEMGLHGAVLGLR